MDHLIMKAKLTDATIKKFLPIENERVEIFDSQLPGFGIRIGKREKIFFVIRRINGKKARLTLGVYPAVSLLEARAKANLEMEKIKKGGDPRADRVQHKLTAKTKGENTFASVAEKFTKEYVKSKGADLRDRTIQGYDWCFRHVDLRAWQERPISEIRNVDVVRVVRKLESDNRLAQAHLVRAYLHRFFKWAVELQFTESNPASGISLKKAKAKDRALNLEELKQVVLSARKLQVSFGTFATLLLLTGQRRGETSKMRWSDLDLDGANPLWKIPVENSKNRRAHDVALSHEVVQLLKSVPRIGDYVFTTDGVHPISDFSRIKSLLDVEIAKTRMEQGLEGQMKAWTWHDLRRSTVTGLNDIGIAPHITEAIVNHVSGFKSGVAGIYNLSTYPAERRLALAAWSRHIMDGQPASNVITLTRGV